MTINWGAVVKENLRFGATKPPHRSETPIPGYIPDEAHGGYVESITKYAKRITYENHAETGVRITYLDGNGREIPTYPITPGLVAALWPGLSANHRH